MKESYKNKENAALGYQSNSKQRRTTQHRMQLFETQIPNIT
jgi:hypothetical protein